MTRQTTRLIQIAERTISVLGQGTWTIGDNAASRKQEIAALRRGVELGMTLIDTAEMYGDGRSETLVGEAIAPMRDEILLVSKVLPSNASRKGTVGACEASLKRLGTDRLDLYLLHWPGRTPLEETVAAFEQLRAEGKIRAWGVSNFDVHLLGRLYGITGGAVCAANQVLYNPGYRGIEFDLLPWCFERKLPVMAYSPVGQGGDLLNAPVLAAVARRHEVTAAQVALAWVLRQANVCAIPKAGSLQHVEENAAAAALELTPQDLAEIDGAYPAPQRKVPLATL